jgi:hypothetical protein
LQTQDWISINVFFVANECFLVDRLKGLHPIYATPQPGIWGAGMMSMIDSDIAKGAPEIQRDPAS